MRAAGPIPQTRDILCCVAVTPLVESLTTDAITAAGAGDVACGAGLSQYLETPVCRSQNQRSFGMNSLLLYR
jgi:hypothetical protein